MQSEGHGDAWWEFVDALITFGSFKLSLLSRHARRASEALGRAAVLSDDMLSEISAHNSARFRERHSLKEISKNLKHELLHHRIKGGARNAVATKESYFRAASGKLLKEAGALTPRHHFDGSILRMLAENAVRSHCALYISEDHTFGGLEQWVCDFARYLRKRNYVPYLIVKGFPALNSRIASEFPGEVLYLQGDDSALAEVIKRCRIESIVVNHVYGGLDNVPETCKVIEVLHNIYFWQVGEDAVAKLRQRVDCFVAVSSEVASYAKIYLSLSVERLVIVPHGINIEGLYRPPVQYLEKVRRRTDAFDILFVGNLYPQKNVICLVEAFAKLRSHASHARLRLAGALSEAEYSAHIKATVERLGLGESVVFLGSLNRAALSREYTHAHMFVFPSLYEGYGLVNLEAAYFGLPMVLSNTGCAETIAQATNACRIARIAAPHDELQRNEIVLKSKRPSQDDVHELYTQIVKIHDDYENYLADGLGMIAKPPFGMADDAGSAVCKLLKSA
jgi:glycosyltransferase involved in cell wall biosynthesis